MELANYIRTLEKLWMIQAYEEPMVFTKNQTLNPILVLSSKISLLFLLTHVKIKTNKTYH